MFENSHMAMHFFNLYIFMITIIRSITKYLHNRKTSLNRSIINKIDTLNKILLNKLLNHIFRDATILVNLLTSLFLPTDKLNIPFSGETLIYNFYLVIKSVPTHKNRDNTYLSDKIN